MAQFRLLHADGSPASCLQVIIKNPGHWDYAMSDDDGQVKVPNFSSGSVVVRGQTIYYGDLEGIIYLP